MDRSDGANHERAIEALLDVLQIINSECDAPTLIRAFLRRVRAWTGCEAVGIRLRQGDDYPYFQVEGSPDEFVRLESHPRTRGPDGAPLRDEATSPVLECMCGRVIGGCFDSSCSSFTEGGSFWTNSTAELPASVCETDRQASTRDRRDWEGCESIALIPLRTAGQTLGLLQISDRQRDRFDLRTITNLERVASAVAMAINEREKAEELRLSEERYRLLFDRNLDGVLITSPDGTIYDANPTACAMLGMTREEVCGRGRSGLVEENAETAVLVRERDRLGWAHGQLTFVRKDGTRFPAEFSSVIMSAGRGTRRSCVVFRDVSERELAAKRLARSEEMMRHIVKYDPTPVAIFDNDMRYLAVSDRFLEQFDMASDNVLGRCHYDLFPHLAGRLKDAHSRALAGEIVREDNDPYESPDGSVVYFRWECRPWFEVDGCVGGIILYIEVTTERVLAQMALEQSEARYRMLFEMESDAIVLVDVETGRVLEANDAACAAYGYSHDEWRSMRYADVSIEPDESRAVDHNGDAWVPLRQHRTKDGRVILVEMSARHLDLNGRRTLLATIRDVTEREQAAQTLRESEERLRQSQKMEAVGQLAGGIAHDFNNLLTTILGYSELILSNGEGDGALLADVAEIKAAAVRASSLTRQILAFSRRQTLAPQVVSLNDVVHNAERILGRTLGEDVIVSIILCPELGLVEVDVSQIEQVLMNLALNARDAMLEGGRLSIETANVVLGDEYCRTHPETVPGSYVMLAVTDTGSGMDERTMEQAFEPFFTTKEQGKGTGLGLSTVYGTISQSGGSISMESHPGEGTRVEIYLPRVDAVLPAVQQPSPSEGAASDSGVVLLVEDDPGLRALATRVLSGLGYEVVQAGDGDQALALAAQAPWPFDLLLTDLMLPGSLKGNQVAETLCAAHPGLRVLFMSGYPRDAIAHAGRLDPGVNYLAKPFTPADLARTVRMILDG